MFFTTVLLSVAFSCCLLLNSNKRAVIIVLHVAKITRRVLQHSKNSRTNKRSHFALNIVQLGL